MEKCDIDRCAACPMLGYGSMESDGTHTSPHCLLSQKYMSRDLCHLTPTSVAIFKAMLTGDVDEEQELILRHVFTVEHWGQKVDRCGDYETWKLVIYKPQPRDSEDVL